MKTGTMVALAAAGLASTSTAVSAGTLTPLATFGSNGWRAPNVIQAGDSAGSNNGSRYNYLGDGLLGSSANLERSFAYNPATGNLILVSRSAAGNGIRILSGTTADDLGAVNQGSGIIGGGTFTTNCVAAGPGGEIYVANLAAGVATVPFKVYKWTGEGAAAPSVFFNSLSPGGTPQTPRLGDSLAISRDGSTLAAGYRTNGSSIGNGYLTITTAAGVATPRQTFTPQPNAQTFYLGLTFGATSNDVLGKATSQSLVYSDYATAVASFANLTSAGEAQISFATIAGVPYLAALDVNNSTVRVYDISSPLTPTLVATGNNTPNAFPANFNLNATGNVQWGAIDDVNQTATLYAMASNEGIQAFTFTVPAPTSGALIGLGGLLAFRRRR